jgi:hypothetical protein
MMKAKAKGQREPVKVTAGLLCFSGVRDGSRDCLLEAVRRGSDSPHVQPNLKLLPASGATRLRGMSSDMSQGQGCKPAAILALSLGESKSQSDDLSQLQNAVWKIRTRSQGLSAIPLLLMLQDVHSPAQWTRRGYVRFNGKGSDNRAPVS